MWIVCIASILIHHHKVVGVIQCISLYFGILSELKPCCRSLLSETSSLRNLRSVSCLVISLHLYIFPLLVNIFYSAFIEYCHRLRVVSSLSLRLWFVRPLLSTAKDWLWSSLFKRRWRQVVNLIDHLLCVQIWSFTHHHLLIDTVSSFVICTVCTHAFFFDVREE